MPNRIIKESFCSSPDVDAMTFFEQSVFVRLIVNVDDYGRIDARPEYLKSKLFVTMQGITSEQINHAVSKLATLGIVKIYEVDNRPYLEFSKWALHQRVRGSKEKYPAPTKNSDLRNLAAMRGELPRAAANCGYNPIQSNPNPNPNPIQSNAGARERPMDETFDRFWEAYPKKAARNRAEHVWAGMHVDEELLVRMLAAIEKQKRSEAWRQENGRYIPNPANWLTDGRWTDELKTGERYGQRDYSENEINQLYVQLSPEELRGGA